MGVAGGGRAAAHDDGDDPLAVPHRGGGEIVARGVGEAGLDAVVAAVRGQQAVGVPVVATVVVPVVQAEIAIVLRVVAHHRSAEDRQVARRGRLTRVGQAVGGGEASMVHAQFAGLGRHAGGELGLGAADVLGQDHGHVVGAADRRGLHGVVQADRLASGQAELGWRLRGGARRDRQIVGQLDLAGFKRLEDQVQGHDLGDGGRVAPGVGEA
ncbi:hypothetical protein D3C86_1004990 [compost metagenome]